MNLNSFGLDWNDPELLADAICQTFLYVETFNDFVSEKALGNSSKFFSTQGLLLEFHQAFRKTGIWPRWVELARLLDYAGKLPTINTDLLDAVCFLLLKPAAVTIKDDNVWQLSGASRLPSISIPSELETPVILTKSGKRAGFATRLPEDLEQSSLGRLRGLFWDQVVDPVAVCHSLLMEISPGKRSVSYSEFLFQRSLRAIFHIRFNNETKYVLAKIVSRFNQIFYSNATPRFEEVQGARSATLSTGILIDQLQILFLPVVGCDSEAAAQQALGLFLFARFCRVLRVRHYRLFPSPHDGSTGQADESIQGQCIGALRRLEYGYLLNRVFGSISDIGGLNFIFRGGMLPRPKTGRSMVVVGPPGSGKTVFALQKLCGVASRGGLAIYFSFEERLDLLVDRLVAFDFIDGDTFDVVPAGNDVTAEIKKREKQRRGLLILFTLGNEQTYPLLDLIKTVAVDAKSWRWRALAIDSINALHLEERVKEELGWPASSREVVREIVETIEEAGYLGLIISEESRSRVEDLEYVADTVIQFGYGQGDRTRWMEVRKCRGQNYHGGHHQIRLIEGKGVSIIPSLGAIRSALRRRTKSTLSSERLIPLPLKRGEVAEKSSTLVYGHHGSGKTLLLLRLATEPTRLSGRVHGVEKPRSVLVINFKTTEARFHKLLAAEREIYARWSGLRMGKVRWYSPGETITGAEVVWEVWQQIQLARRSGLPIDRIVFDEVENAIIAVPYVAKEPLFWTTLLQLIGAEAITAFLGFNLENDSDVGTLNILRSEVDYVFRIGAGRAAETETSKSENRSATLDQSIVDLRLEVLNEKRPDELRPSRSEPYPLSDATNFGQGSEEELL